MIHISLTGFHAGTIICGKKREDFAEGERAAHIGKWLDNPELHICPKCKEIYDSAEEEMSK